MKISEDLVWAALRKVIDPELGVSIVDLGLVYDVRYDQGEVEVEMTMTSPGCPMVGIIEKEVRRAVVEVAGVKKVVVEIVWDPPWSQEMMSEELKAEFGW